MNLEFERLTGAFARVPKPTDVLGDPYGIDATKEDINRILNADPNTLMADDFLGVFGYNANPELILYLFPAALRIWRDELFATQSWFSEQFHGDMARIDFLTENLTRAQTDETLRFIRSGFLTRVRSEHSLSIDGYSATHRWPGILASLGTWTEDIEYLWTTIWSAESQGEAIAAVQYASCIICTRHCNPIFTPRTPSTGGGAPVLWHYEAMPFRLCWKAKNVAFLRGVLSSEYLDESLERCSRRLYSTPHFETVQNVRSELRANPHVAARRCTELPNRFEFPSNSAFPLWD